MDHQEALDIAVRAVRSLQGHTIDTFTIKRPNDMQGAIERAKIITKLSAVVANLLEYAAVQYLNANYKWPAGCVWVRQDPGFPDTALAGMIEPQPGIEFKTWCPFATEITARFKGSQTFIKRNNTKVAMLFWLPEDIIAGQPKIIDVWIGEALDVAQAREQHYHQPPGYIVMEPEETASRTRNLRQTNTGGYKFQGSAADLREAAAFAQSLGLTPGSYDPDPGYQARLRQLFNRYPYRQESNFPKMDRIVLPSLEAYKAHVLNSEYRGRTIREWKRVLRMKDASALAPFIDIAAPPPVC